MAEDTTERDQGGTPGDDDSSAQTGPERALDANSEEAGESASWGAAMRRIGGGLLPRRRPRRRWSLLVPVIAALAGLLFTTTAHTAAGTNLRDDRRPEAHPANR